MSALESIAGSLLPLDLEFMACYAAFLVPFSVPKVYAEDVVPGIASLCGTGRYLAGPLDTATPKRLSHCFQ